MGNVESSAIPEKFTVLTQDQKAYYDEKFNALLKAGKSEVEAIAELLQSEGDANKIVDPYRDLILDEVFLLYFFKRGVL